MRAEIGDKVSLKMDNESDSPLLTLLNTLPGEIVGYREKNGSEPFAYQVAFPLTSMPEIQEAAAKHYGTKAKVLQLTIVGLSRALNRPKDARYYTIAYTKEVKVI